MSFSVASAAASPARPASSLGDPQGRPVAQHGCRRGEPGGVRAEPGQPHPHAAGQRLRADGVHGRGTAGGGLDPLGAQRDQQLAQEQRVAAALALAGVGERGLGLALHGHRDVAGDRRAGQRPWAQHDPARIVDHGGRRRIAGVRLTRPQPGDEHHGQAVEPALEVGEEAQAGRVDPVQVVDGDEHRPARREVHEQPVEAVAGGEGAVGPRVGAVASGVEQRRGEAGGPTEQLLALGSVEPAEQRLEELQRHAVGELALELPPLPHSTSRPASAASVRAVASSRVLPMPGGPSTTTSCPAPSWAASSTGRSAATSGSRSSSSSSASAAIGQTVPGPRKVWGFSWWWTHCAGVRAAPTLPRCSASSSRASCC